MTTTERAVEIAGCELDEGLGVQFCAAHDEDGNPPWDRCRWVAIAEALEDARRQGYVDGVARGIEMMGGAAVDAAEESRRG